MREYTPTIGLEIHAELKTKTKMFCSCKNDADEVSPNVHICPVCMAHPGTLPVINREAVRKVLLVGAALNSILADYSEFDRKNYFYPDIPKGYQISQYKYPLVKGGSLQGVALTRIHLEEDTASSQHISEKSLVDYNRAGVPLMELVTEPVIHDPETAGSFARELQLLLRYLGVSEANMEKGEMRVEANISVSPDGTRPSTLGTKVEVKNLNSFRSVERAIRFEVERQIKVLEGGGTVIQETKGWDDAKQETYSQRIKESSEDYRYFPEPDLPKLQIKDVSELSTHELKSRLPVLPWERRDAYIQKFKLKTEDADLFVRDPTLGNFFDMAQVYSSSDEGAKLVANYISSDIAGSRESGIIGDEWLGNDQNAKRFGALITLLMNGSLSSRGAKDTLWYMFSTLDEPESIAKAHGLIQRSDQSYLSDIVAKIIDSNPAVVASYKSGKVEALQFLVGQGMKESKGAANPEVLRKLFVQELKQP